MYGFSIEIDRRVKAGVCSDRYAMEHGVVLPTQTHSSNVAVVNEAVADIPDTDALICTTMNMAIGIRTADCVPLLLYAPDIHAVAAVHAGWRGSLSGIVDNTIHKLRQLGASPESLKAAFGPSICGKCYEVSVELAHSFIGAGFSTSVNGRYIDLEAVNTHRLISAGVPEVNIKPKSFCTYETPLLPSWRRLHSDSRMVNWIKLLNK